MTEVLAVAPFHWRPLVDAMVGAFGTEVRSVLGSRPSYNLYDVFRRVMAERSSMQELLRYSSPGWADLVQSFRASKRPVDVEAVLEGVPDQLLLSYSLQRTIELTHAERPLDVLVTTCTFDVVGRSVLAAGRRLGVPVVCVQHGCHTVVPEDAWYCAEALPDVLCVPGERDRKWWERCFRSPAKHGRPEVQTRVEETGHPLWDGYAARWEERRERKPGERPTVLWAAESGANAAQTPVLWASRDVPVLAWRAFLRAMEACVEPLHLVLKVREGEDPHYVESWSERLRHLEPRHTVTVSDAPAIDVLPGVDAVICQDSNLGVEALHLGIPVLSITRKGGGLFDRDEYLTFDGEDLELDRKLLRSLTGTLESLRRGHELGAEVLRDEARYYNRGVDGSATARVLQVIGEVGGAG